MTAATPRKRLRADAQRNRDKLVAEASELFRRQGADASLEEVARRAGVAIGTLYGHFPTRQALLAAVLLTHQQRLYDLADELEAEEPGVALQRWLRELVRHAAAFSGLATMLLGSIDDPGSEMYAACKEMTVRSDRILDRARAAGAVRPDATGEDVFVLVNAAAWVRGQTPAEQADRVLTVMLDGLAAPRGV